MADIADMAVVEDNLKRKEIPEHEVTVIEEGDSIKENVSKIKKGNPAYEVTVIEEGDPRVSKIKKGKQRSWYNPASWFDSFTSSLPTDDEQNSFDSSPRGFESFELSTYGGQTPVLRKRHFCIQKNTTSSNQKRNGNTKRLLLKKARFKSTKKTKKRNKKYKI